MLPRGRAGQPLETRPGLFVRNYLIEKGSEGASIKEIHRAYKERLGYYNPEDPLGILALYKVQARPYMKRPARRYVAAKYESFKAMFHIFINAGYVEFTGREEISTSAQFTSGRWAEVPIEARPRLRYYRITPEGIAAPMEHWLNPRKFLIAPPTPVPVLTSSEVVSLILSAWDELDTVIMRIARLPFTRRPAEVPAGLEAIDKFAEGLRGALVETKKSLRVATGGERRILGEIEEILSVIIDERVPLLREKLEAFKTNPRVGTWLDFSDTYTGTLAMIEDIEGLIRR